MRHASQTGSSSELPILRDMVHKSLQWRNLYSVLALCVGIFTVYFCSPNKFIHEADISCHGSKTVLARLPNLDSCVVKLNQVPDWKFCSCYIPENEWWGIYWLVSVPTIMVIACWIFIRITAINLFLFISAAYSVIAVFSFNLINSPLSGVTLASVNQLLGASILGFIVLLPQMVLYVAQRISSDRKSEVVLTVLAITVTVIGVFAYSGSFDINDGEYALVYFITPIIQAPFALAALIYSIVIHRKNLTIPKLTTLA